MAPASGWDRAGGAVVAPPLRRGAPRTGAPSLGLGARERREAAPTLPPGGVRLAPGAASWPPSPPTERRIAVLVNPAAGRDEAGDRTARLEAAFARVGLKARVQAMEPHALRTAIDGLIHEGYGTIVAAGGDGTVSAVAQHLVGRRVTLGVVPMGTLNHFARDLGLPIDLDGAVDVIARGAVRAVDVGEVNGRAFLNNASLGLYPDQVRMRARLRSRFSKPVAAFVASLAALRRLRALWLTVERDGARVRLRCPMVLVGNGEYGLDRGEPTSRARLDEGVLSLCLYTEARRLGLVVGAIRALFGRASAVRHLEVDRVREALLRVSRRRVPVALDGEVVTLSSPLRFRSVTGALRVIGPPGAS